MTRINANIPPHEIVNKHLMGEFFEIRRVRIYKPDHTIKNFRFGTGHVKFFSTFKHTTLQRLDDISKELLQRGLVSLDSVTLTRKLFHDAWGDPETYSHLFYDYTDNDTDTARLRLANSLIGRVFSKSEFTKYDKENITLVQSLQLLDVKTFEALELMSNIINAAEAKHIGNLLHYKSFLP